MHAFISLPLFSPTLRIHPHALCVTHKKCTHSIHSMHMSLVIFLQYTIEAVRRMCTRLVVPGRPLTSEDKAFVEFGQDISYDPCSQAVAFVERSGVHPIVVLVGLYYLARIRRKFPSLSITTTNASRLMLVAWSSAAKYVDDRSYRLKNKHWVKIGGGWLSLEKFNKMEMEFMSLLEYNLSIDHDEFNRFCRFCGVSVDLGW
eukprot:TRINITY_DN1166_c0_g1_i1.p1 TRINITY_DN1166_c0_g1~~TRINITY_DN1166_c0_g1_i1.p1  ORF type:complete len:202 (+),score=34.88 TRINITY_DN1166_c0_g1_i1:439-1044(+)